jgi:hypothetical protein
MVGDIECMLMTESQVQDRTSPLPLMTDKCTVSDSSPRDVIAVMPW